LNEQCVKERRSVDKNKAGGHKDEPTLRELVECSRSYNAESNGECGDDCTWDPLFGGKQQWSRQNAGDHRNPHKFEWTENDRAGRT
jgi:hypothetical protein